MGLGVRATEVCQNCVLKGVRGDMKGDERKSGEKTNGKGKNIDDPVWESPTFSNRLF